MFAEGNNVGSVAPFDNPGLVLGKQSPGLSMSCCRGKVEVQRVVSATDVLTLVHMTDI